MMTNLFSTFDPATSMKMSANWISSIMYLMIIPMYYWKMNNRLTIMIKMMSKKLDLEFKTLMGKSKSMTLPFISLFMFIMMNNIMGLLPYIFTSSSHMTFSLTLALPLWLTLMIYGWTQKTNHMFLHLIPSGTPPILMPFMTLIETTSNIIRPGSLAVRLTANMIAGHLLMSLLGNNFMNMKLFPIILIIQMMLMLFEMAVALIQAYVFSVLMTLYSSEVI
uniref:ATP synthase F0 subunit 6 n=1 Tax=Eucosmetus incisus TaxID=2676338 RepID=UPI002E75DAAD|nr:ATP synthase F0 subunit 6 [Eucosmetus incisus]WQH58278.1 ATP synthase F0 subunit 6 [Eucosmetus incisus]